MLPWLQNQCHFDEVQHGAGIKKALSDGYGGGQHSRRDAAITCWLRAYCNLEGMCWKRKLLIITSCWWRSLFLELGLFLFIVYGGKHEASHGLVENYLQIIVGRPVSINSSRLTGIRKTVWLFRDVFEGYTCPFSPGSQLNAGCNTMCVDCKTLIFCPDDEGCWRLML